MIVSLAFFGLSGRYGGPKAVLTRFLSIFELFGGMVLAAVMFLIIYYGFRQDQNSGNWKLAMGGAGMALILVGSLICAPSWTSIGMFIMVIALVIGGAMSIGSGGISGSKDNTKDTSTLTPEEKAAVEKAKADKNSKNKGGGLFGGRGKERLPAPAVEFTSDEPAPQQVPQQSQAEQQAIQAQQAQAAQAQEAARVEQQAQAQEETSEEEPRVDT
jgi:hypothetical protein